MKRAVREIPTFTYSTLAAIVPEHPLPMLSYCLTTRDRSLPETNILQVGEGMRMGSGVTCTVDVDAVLETGAENKSQNIVASPTTYVLFSMFSYNIRMASAIMEQLHWSPCTQHSNLMIYRIEYVSRSHLHM